MIRPLKGGKRTSARAAFMSQNDPNRTLARGLAGLQVVYHEQLLGEMVTR